MDQNNPIQQLCETCGRWESTVQWRDKYSDAMCDKCTFALDADTLAAAAITEPGILPLEPGQPGYGGYDPNNPPPLPDDPEPEDTSHEVKYEFSGTPGPWYPVQYACYWEICTEPFYGESDLLNEDHCIHASRNARLAASSPLLLSALIKAVEEADQIKERAGKWDVPYPDWYNEAKAAIHAALNINTTKY